MSGATHRITTEYLPADSPMFPWQARVVRLSDGEYVAAIYGVSEQDALTKAADHVRTEYSHSMLGGVYETDDEGNISPLRPSPSFRDGAA